MQMDLVNRETALKGLCALIHPTTQCRDSSLYERYFFANLKTSTRGERVCWDTLWEWRHWWATFLCSPSTLLNLVRTTFFWWISSLPSNIQTPFLYFPSALRKLAGTTFFFPWWLWSVSSSYSPFAMLQSVSILSEGHFCTHLVPQFLWLSHRGHILIS